MGACAAMTSIRATLDEPSSEDDDMAASLSQASEPNEIAMFVVPAVRFGWPVDFAREECPPGDDFSKLRFGPQAKRSKPADTQPPQRVSVRAKVMLFGHCAC